MLRFQVQRILSHILLIYSYRYNLCSCASKLQWPSTMQLASVSLPKLHLSDNGQHLHLSLKGSLKLQFPDGVKVPQTSTGLLKSATEEHLWIARTGSCHFHVTVSIQGERVTAADQIAELTEWIQYCQVCFDCRLYIFSRVSY